MLTIQYILPSPLIEAAQPVLPEKEPEPPRRRRLRLYLVGSKDDVQHTVNHLHIQGCIDRGEWSRDIEVPEGGLIIRPDPDDVLKYLQRYRRFG